MGSFSIWHWIIVLFILAVPVAIGAAIWLIVRASRSRTVAAPPALRHSGSTSPNPSAESRLRELENLKTKGLISVDEYEHQRATILGSV